MQQSGLFWHLHHTVLLEWCYDYDDRAEFIRTRKLPKQQELRLRLFQPVKGQLPQEVVEAGKALGWKLEVYNRAVSARHEADWGIHKEASSACDEAERIYLEGLKPYAEVLFNHKDEIEALHAKECLDCPWDGETIFPKVLVAV